LPASRARLSDYFLCSDEIGRNILQPNDILYPVLDVEPGDAGDAANITFFAWFAGYVNSVECAPGLLNISVPISVHITAHQGRNVQVIRALGYTLLTLMTV
jgi:hypothetical protein